jgi:hypothetical protein
MFEKGHLITPKKEVFRMTKKVEKKEFVDPQLMKCEEPLDKVTLFINPNCYGHPRKED